MTNASDFDPMRFFVVIPLKASGGVKPLHFLS